MSDDKKANDKAAHSTRVNLFQVHFNIDLPIPGLSDVTLTAGEGRTARLEWEPTTHMFFVTFTDGEELMVPDTHFNCARRKVK